MPSVYGFIEIDDYANNETGKVATIGELSKYSQTFSMENGKYANTTIAPGLELYTFRNRGLMSNTPTPPPTNELTTHILAVAAWVHLEAISGYITSDSGIFQQNFQNAFEKVTGIDCGVLVENENQCYYPEWLSWRTETGDDIKIWFCDGSFRNQYTGYDIAFLTPVDAVDDLFTRYANVATLLNERPFTATTKLIKDLGAKNPYTSLEAQAYDWYDFQDTTKTLVTNWPVLVWGQAGTDYDVIREELVTYILANSSHSRSEWEVVLPDLFKRTEFVIVPAWDQYAIPNQTTKAGLYSPGIKPADAKVLANRGMPGYDSVHVDENLRIYNTFYRSLGWVVCGNEDNRDGITDLGKKFTDYICVSTTHADFNRIDPVTQAWILQLVAGFKLAETMTEYSELEDGFLRLKRNGNVYCAFTYQKVQYLILTKNGLNAGTELSDVVGDGIWVRQNGEWVQGSSASEVDAALTN